ncbi:HHHH-motif protein [Variovorax sp. Root318D1]|uniref:HHHH-motif protein n=1 Tax=Variovorax sp. Root318D1 TaxID=1736513 RepID=UPI000A4C806E|nr:HHHH-motif protein [Variovorax sp. Root318D1]
MQIKQIILSSAVAFASLAVLAPSMAAAAPYRGHEAQRAHKVCKWDAHRHHRVCHWVR